MSHADDWIEMRRLRATRRARSSRSPRSPLSPATNSSQAPMSSPMQKSTLSSERRSRAPTTRAGPAAWVAGMIRRRSSMRIRASSVCRGLRVVDLSIIPAITTGKPECTDHHDRREGGRSHSRPPPAPATFEPAVLPVARLGEGAAMTAKNTQQGASDQGQSGSPRRRLPSRASPRFQKTPGRLPANARLLKSAIGAQVVGLFKDQSRREKTRHTSGRWAIRPTFSCVASPWRRNFDAGRRHRGITPTNAAPSGPGGSVGPFKFPD